MKPNGGEESEAVKSVCLQVPSDEQLQKYTQDRLAHTTSLVVVTTLVPFFSFHCNRNTFSIEEKNKQLIAFSFHCQFQSMIQFFLFVFKISGRILGGVWTLGGAIVKG